MVINSAWGGAGFAFGAYLITLVVSLFVVGMIKLIWIIIHRAHKTAAAADKN